MKPSKRIIAPFAASSPETQPDDPTVCAAHLGGEPVPARTPTFSVLTHFADAFYDLERFGIRLVASPRYADVLLVSGPVIKNMTKRLG